MSLPDHASSAGVRSTQQRKEHCIHGGGDADNLPSRSLLTVYFNIFVFQPVTVFLLFISPILCRYTDDFAAYSLFMVFNILLFYVTPFAHVPCCFLLDCCEKNSL